LGNYRKKVHIPPTHVVRENLTGGEIKVPGAQGGRVEKNHLIAREDEDFFWKNPERCTEFSVIESFTKIILSFFKLKAKLCVVGQQGIFAFQTDLITSKFLTQ